jgi:hypothetical protein
MAKSKRNTGAEVLRGLREIKRGEVGRVVNVPDIPGIRDADRKNQGQSTGSDEEVTLPRISGR